MSTVEKSYSSNFDFSGMEQFWKIVSILESDGEPDVEEWNALFDTPGYRVLVEEEFPRDFFIKYFTLAFMPSKENDLKMEMKKGGMAAEFLKHYIRVRNMKKEIKSQERKLMESSSYILNSAMNLARKYLPSGTVDGCDLPQISFVIFAYDARGYSPIVIDLLFSIDLGAYLPYLLGHELHHFYRNKQLKFRFPKEMSRDRYILWVLNQIQAEGIADLIDKPYLLFNEYGIFNRMKFGKMYKEYLNKSPEIIKKMDDILKKLRCSPEDYDKLNQEFFKIVPMSGHSVGYFMANLIIKKLGKETLIKEMGDPFSFLRLYNEAATMESGYPIFSKESMDLLYELEEKYKK